MATIKTPAEIELIAEAGRRLAKVLAVLKKEVKPGIPTTDLDQMAHDLIVRGGDNPAFLGYRPNGAGKPYPFSICASLNDGVVHGLPSERELAEGDLLKIDIGLVHKGWYSDMAITVGVGDISHEASRLITVTEEALRLGIEAVKPGSTLGDIGHAIQAYVEANGFGVVRALTGHGIGRELHEDPHVYNFGNRGEGEKVVPGMVLAIEPMVTMGKYPVKQLPDDSFVTKDGSLAAHFEHTVAITEKGARILTRN